MIFVPDTPGAFVACMAWRAFSSSVTTADIMDSMILELSYVDYSQREDDEEGDGCVKGKGEKRSPGTQ